MNRDGHVDSIVSDLGRLGYTAEIVAATPFEASRIDVSSFDRDDPFWTPLTITPFPEDAGIEDTVFVQFFFACPEVPGGDVTSLLSSLPAASRQLPLGHFNTMDDGRRLTFRYVLVAPKDHGVQQEVLNDVMDMCVHALEDVAPVLLGAEGESLAGAATTERGEVDLH